MSTDSTTHTDDVLDDPRVPSSLDRDYILNVIGRTITVATSERGDSELRRRMLTTANSMITMVESSDLIETGVDTPIGGPDGAASLSRRLLALRSREKRPS